MQSIKEMEPFIDLHLQRLRENIDRAADSGETVDIKDLFAYYIVDVLGELAFSRSFDAQRERIPQNLPPINEHIFLACLLGQMPELLPLLKKLAVYTPIPWVQQLLAARGRLKDLTADCVRTRLRQKVDRKDLLTCLINAEDPETGAKLTELDINTEAFAMM